MTEMPTTAAARVFQGIRDQILYGELEPGTRLTHRQLAAEFGTSNIPVVESIRRLEGDGLLVTHPKWGAQVNEWTPDDIEGIFAMREGLEATTCRLFVQRATAAEKLDLLEYGRQYDRHAQSRDVRATTEADIAFHLYIVRCTRALNLYRLAETSCVITAAIRNHFFRDEQVFSEHVGGLAGVHDELIGALRSGDAARAEAAGRAHVAGALEKLRAIARRAPEESK